MNFGGGYWESFLAPYASQLSVLIQAAGKSRQGCGGHSRCRAYGSLINTDLNCASSIDKTSYDFVFIVIKIWEHILPCLFLWEAIAIVSHWACNAAGLPRATQSSHDSGMPLIHGFSIDVSRGKDKQGGKQVPVAQSLHKQGCLEKLKLPSPRTVTNQHIHWVCDYTETGTA